MSSREITMHVKLILTLGCISQVFSVPVTSPSTTTQCTTPCQWTQWLNVDHPQDQIDSGDFETLVNIRARGYNVCRAPRDIRCRSVQFPYVPYSALLYKSQCDPSVGFICRNKDNVAKCVDFEVQLLCCPCDQVNDTQKSTTIPAVSTATPATPCENPTCSWTQWFNSHNPTPDPDGGDFENITAIRQQGYPVCTSPQAIQCRLQRFPYVPFKELYSVQECSISNGLVCLNKNQPNWKCPDYEVQFQCCVCNPSTHMQSEETTMEAPKNVYMFIAADAGSGTFPNDN